jgi:hypothetical protein
MEQVAPTALTTLQRVKDLLFDPNLTISLTGCVLNSTTNVTGVTVPAGKTIRVSQPITGTYIPAGTTIAAIVSSTQITLSQAATSTASGQTLTVTDQPTAFDTVLTRLINSVSSYISTECGRVSFVQQTYTNEVYSIDNPNRSFLTLRNTPVFSLTSLQFRAGTPSNPSWTDFTTDQYELIDPIPNPSNSGALYYPKGIVRVYGVLPSISSNAIRATYVAGYPVNWANAGDQNTHMLPADITYVCENLVVRRFTRRQLAGKSSDRISDASVSWRNEIDAEDLDVLGQYRLLNF